MGNWNHSQPIFTTYSILEPQCPAEWERFNSNCYYFQNSSSYLTWAWAGNACKDLNHNSTLPSVHSAEEDRFLKEKTGYQTFWLGASRAVGASYYDPNSWSWSDGSPMNFTAWASRQPNNYWWGERCVRSVDWGQENSWDDHKCWSRTALTLVCKMTPNK